MIDDEMTQMEDKAFSSIDFVGQCLFDPEKAELFEKRITEVMKPGYRVLDVGTGSGILALLSAKAGAKEVTALEFDPFVAEIARENFKNNGCADKIELLVGDARDYDFGKRAPFDVVTMEMLSSGMVDEMQVQAVGNLHRRGVVSPSTVFIPGNEETFISLINADFNLFGLHMKMILHDWKVFKDIKTQELTEAALLNSIDFSEAHDELFDATVTLAVREDGVANALWLTSRASMGGAGFLENTISVNPPVAIPIPERKVSKGEKISARVRYKFGHGYQNFRVAIS